MDRRSFLRSALAAAAADSARAALPQMKITRVRYYESPLSRPLINQSMHVVTVETDAGLTGVGEGGSPDLIRQCGALLISEDPSRIDHLWQLMYRGHFYPAGREKLHALGALDMALWDIKGKALGVPLYELLGGRSREHIECYSTGFPRKGTLAETARACIEAGFRAFRTSVSDPGGNAPFSSQQMVRRTYEQCVQIREGVGKDGDHIHLHLDHIDPSLISSRTWCARRIRASTAPSAPR